MPSYEYSAPLLEFVLTFIFGFVIYLFLLLIHYYQTYNLEDKQKLNEVNEELPSHIGFMFLLFLTIAIGVYSADLYQGTTLIRHPLNQNIGPSTNEYKEALEKYEARYREFRHMWRVFFSIMLALLYVITVWSDTAPYKFTSLMLYLAIAAVVCSLFINWWDKRDFVSQFVHIFCASCVIIVKMYLIMREKNTLSRGSSKGRLHIFSKLLDYISILLIVATSVTTFASREMIVGVIALQIITIITILNLEYSFFSNNTTPPLLAPREQIIK